MPEDPPLERCFICPVPRETELRSNPPIEGCPGPLFTLGGLVEVTDISGEVSLRASDPDPEALDMHCGREDIGLDEKNSFEVVVGGIRYAFRLSRKTARAVEGRSPEEKQKLGETILADFNLRTEGQNEIKEQPNGRPRLSVIQDPETLVPVALSDQQIYAEIFELSKGTLIHETAIHCDNYIDLVRKALQKVLRNSRHLEGFQTLLAKAKQANVDILANNKACIEYMAIYGYENIQNDEHLTPAGYKELQQRVDDLKQPKKTLRSTTVSGLRSYLQSISDGIEAAPFGYLSVISNERDRFIKALLSTRAEDFAGEVIASSEEVRKAAAEGARLMKVVKDGLPSLPF